MSNEPTFSVRRLSQLFGKSEDTIRRWKNDGIGTGAENVKLIPEDEKNTRHLVFTLSAVRDFTAANPYLLDGAPELRKLLEDHTPPAAPQKTAGAAAVAAASFLPKAMGAAAAAPGIGSYLYELLLHREQQLKQSLEQLQAEEQAYKDELAQLQAEKARFEQQGG